jgi:hypothetical protein
MLAGISNCVDLLFLLQMVDAVLRLQQQKWVTMMELIWTLLHSALRVSGNGPLLAILAPTSIAGVESPGCQAGIC